MERQSQACNDRGQGTLEYVLLLVTAISLVTAIAFRIFMPFNKWLKVYMGSYLECLLDAGELPTLGTVGGGGQICNQYYEGFSLANGRPPKDDSAAKGSDHGKKDSDNDQDRRDRGPLAKGEGSSGVGARSPREHRARGRPSVGADRPNELAGGAKETGQESGSSQFYRFTGDGGQLSNRAKKRVVEGGSRLMAEEQEKEKQKSDKVRKMSSVSEGGGSKDAKRFHVRKPDKVGFEGEPDEPWSLGKIFRWAIILMILVAILLFLVNQARQISKGMEK